MRTVPILLLLMLTVAALSVPTSATAPACVSVNGNVDCDVAISAFGSADGTFVAVSGTGDATTHMDYCLEWVCPSAAVSAYGDAYASCHASSVCVALAGKGHAGHDGAGVSFGGCDLLFHVCYPVRVPAPLLA